MVFFRAQPNKRTPKSGDKKKSSSKVKEPKGKCFHCGAEGHWKRNCKMYLSRLKNKSKVNMIYWFWKPA